MSARLRRDDNWPKQFSSCASPAPREQAALPQPAPLRLVTVGSGSVSSGAAAPGALGSTARFAGWSAAVCLLTVGPGALPYELCRAGGEAIVGLLFAGRVIDAVLTGTLPDLLRQRSAWDRLALAWLGIAAASAVWSYATGWGPRSPYPTPLYNGGPAGPLRLLADACVAVMGYFAAAQAPVGAPQSPVRRLAPLLASAAAVAALCALEWARNCLVGTDDPRLQASFTNPNLLGGYLCIALPVSLGIALDASARPPARWMSGALAAILAAALWLSGSRGALLGCAAGSALLLVSYCAGKLQAQRAVNPARQPRFVLIVLAVLLIGSAPLITRLAHRSIAAGSHSVSDAQRRVAWQGAELIVRRHPLTGLGLGSYPAALGALRLAQADPNSPDSAPRILAMHLHAHDLLLEFWAERGLPGCLLVLALAGCTAAASIRCLSAPLAGSSCRLLPTCACAALLATLVQNVADYTLWYAPLLILFWQLPALMTSARTADN